MPSKTAYGAGLKDCKIKTAEGNEYDVFAIVSANADPQSEEVEVRGDDSVLGSFNFALTEELTLVANGISFEVLQEILGNNYTSDADSIEIATGTDSEQNPPFVEVSTYTTAKDGDGTTKEIVKIWHKVQLKLTGFSQAGEQEFNIELTGKAIPTALDIEGAALASRRIATVKVQTPAA